MTLSAPSFLAAATSASIPPMAWAEVASFAATPALPEALLLVVVPELLGGAHAVTARAAPRAIDDSSARRVVTVTASCFGHPPFGGRTKCRVGTTSAASNRTQRCDCGSVRNRWRAGADGNYRGGAAPSDAVHGRLRS